MKHVSVYLREVFVRNPYNYDVIAASVESGVDCSFDKGRTIQSAKEETDINTIVKRFGITGQLPVGVRMPSWGDFTEVFDYQTAMNALVAARESFMTMPANVRARFHNDAAEFVDFCSLDENRAEAIKLGLVVPPEAPFVPDPVRVEVVVPESLRASAAVSPVKGDKGV